MNKLSILALTIAAVSFSSQANTDTKSMTVSVQVQNTFTLTPGDGLSFGKLLAFADTDTSADHKASITLPANPAGKAVVANAGAAKIQSLEEGKPGSFTIAGLAPFSNLKIEAPATTTIAGALAVPGAPTFELSDLKFYIEGGPNNGKNYDDQSTTKVLLTSDDKGNAKFYVGGKLSTLPKATQAAYQDGNYTANVDVTVTYN